MQIRLHAFSRCKHATPTTAEVLPSVSKVAGVWRSLSWCLESVMLWRGIMGFTKFGDKCVNDLDLL
jgi:hypothetical protein